MRTVLFFDQIQAGHGGKDKPDVELGVSKGGIGSYTMFDRFAKKQELNVVATIYCGTSYFFEHQDEVKEKIAKLLTKVKAEVLICGPTFDYPEFAKMAAVTAAYVQDHSECKTLAMCALEKNADTIEAYKDEITIVKMPKKGGIGLNDSLDTMTQVARGMVEGTIPEALKDSIY